MTRKQGHSKFHDISGRLAKTEVTEARPGRETDTDRVCEEIFEGVRLAEPVRVSPRGQETRGILHTTSEKASLDKDLTEVW
jgi:hypothetical protein